MATGRWLKCCTHHCGVHIYLSNEEETYLVQSGKSFFCKWGHSQVFSKGETPEDKLRRERDRLVQEKARIEEERDAAIRARALAERAAEHHERSASAHKGVATKLKKRAAAGVCPCCNRQFVGLARHMASKHPDFLEKPTIEARAN